MKLHLFKIPREVRPEAERARFMILSVKELRRDQISSGIYGHIYILLRFIYYGHSEDGVWQNDVTRRARGLANSVRRSTPFYLIIGPAMNPLGFYFFFLLSKCRQTQEHRLLNNFSKLSVCLTNQLATVCPHRATFHQPEKIIHADCQQN